MVTQNEGPQYDCVFVKTNSEMEGMGGLDIAHIYQFFSFNYMGRFYPCALIHWFSHVVDEPDEETGMWVVKPESLSNGSPFFAVIYVDCIIWVAHLLSVYDKPIPSGVSMITSLDYFKSYYINKYVDYHAFEVAS